eukprot:1005762-Rhodomonas_salina.1
MLGMNSDPVVMPDHHAQHSVSPASAASGCVGDSGQGRSDLMGGSGNRRACQWPPGTPMYIDAILSLQLC